MAEASRTFHSSLLLPRFSRSASSFHRSSASPSISRKNHIRCSVSAASSDGSTRVAEAARDAIPWGCDIDSLDNASALERWLTESGLPPQKMTIDRVDIGERGLVARKNIRKGEKLLFVPPSLVITADSEWSNPEAGDILKRNFVPDWPLIATYLISEASLMQSSKWSNYISALPRQPYSLLYWTRSELDTYLVASQIRERAIERITNVTGTYNDLRARIFSKYPHLFPEEVRLPSMEGRVALVPWADMLNHSPEVETFLDYDKSSQGIVFATDRPYQPGEQVFISYGKKSNGELLLSYGFVPREGTNPNDSVDLPMSLNKSDRCYKEKSEVLWKYGLSTSLCFPLQITGWPLELMAYAYLVVSSPGMNEHFEEVCVMLVHNPKSRIRSLIHLDIMAAAASNKSTDKKDKRYPEIEEQALQYILDCCESSISKYTKFLEGSGSVDSVTTTPKTISRKLLLKQLAIDLCTSEQRILFRTQYILRRRLRDMRTGELRALRILDGFKKLFK